MYHWPPVWLVWNQLYDNWQFLFLFAKQTNLNQSNRRSTVQWYFPLQYSLELLLILSRGLEKFDPAGKGMLSLVLSFVYDWNGATTFSITLNETRDSAQWDSMLGVVYADCHLCWVSKTSPLCWVSLCCKSWRHCCLVKLGRRYACAVLRLIQTSNFSDRFQTWGLCYKTNYRGNRLPR